MVVFVGWLGPMHHTQNMSTTWLLFYCFLTCEHGSWPLREFRPRFWPREPPTYNIIKLKNLNCVDLKKCNYI